MELKDTSRNKQYCVIGKPVGWNGEGGYDLIVSMDIN